MNCFCSSFLHISHASSVFPAQAQAWFALHCPWAELHHDRGTATVSQTEKGDIQHPALGLGGDSHGEWPAAPTPLLPAPLRTGWSPNPCDSQQAVPGPRGQLTPLSPQRCFLQAQQVRVMCLSPPLQARKQPLREQRSKCLKTHLGACLQEGGQQPEPVSPRAGVP